MGWRGALVRSIISYTTSIVTSEKWPAVYLLWGLREWCAHPCCSPHQWAQTWRSPAELSRLCTQFRHKSCLHCKRGVFCKTYLHKSRCPAEADLDQLTPESALPTIHLYLWARRLIQPSFHPSSGWTDGWFNRGMMNRRFDGKMAG